MRIFLADPGHNQITKNTDSYPLGIANLATYLGAYLKTDCKPEISIFREPEDLKKALDDASPDVLALSSYMWNHQLSLSFARYAKRRNPKTITMMGGPNFPLVTEDQERFLRGIPEIDVAVRGTTEEGERAFLAVMQRLVDTGGRLEGLLEEPVPGNLWIDPKTGEFVQGAPLERIENLDEIPSPYLAGLMEPFWSTGYYPIMQIARGCPFACQFCNSAPANYSRVYAHSVENVKADLLYIAERVKSTVALCFADDNFGMYERDVEIADYIGWLQDKYNWPRYIRATTGKNRAERIIQVMRKIRGALPMTSAVQSMNPVVLKNIQRTNIKLETYAEIQKEVLAQGMQSYGEIILSMPGETKESILRAFSDMIASGVKRISATQLILSHGAPLSNSDQRERFQFRSHFRVVARHVGDYGTGEPVIEIEEMVAETPTLSFAEYLEVRVLHLLLVIFYYEGNFEEAFKYANEHGIKSFDLMRTAQRILDRAPESIRQLIDNFVKESHEELFDSHEEATAWAKSRFPELVSGELGGNLLSKHSMMARFYLTRESAEFIGLAISEALGEQMNSTAREELAAVIEYLQTVLLRAPFRETMAQTEALTSRYDVEAWRSSHDAHPLSAFKAAEPIAWQTSMDPEWRAIFEQRLAMFGESPSTMGKFTRTVFANQLRKTLVRADAPKSIESIPFKRVSSAA